MKLVYMDMTPGSSQYTLNMLLTGTSTSRTWKIRISQIPCGATYAGTFTDYSTVTQFLLTTVPRKKGGGFLKKVKSTFAL